MPGNLELQEKCREWIRANSRRKGQRNMTVEDFQKFVNRDLFKVGTAASMLSEGDAGIRKSAARLWIYRLGFVMCTHKKR